MDLKIQTVYLKSITKNYCDYCSILVFENIVVEGGVNVPQSIMEKPIEVGGNENGGRKNNILCFCSIEHEYLLKANINYFILKQVSCAY